MRRVVATTSAVRQALRWLAALPRHWAPGLDSLHTQHPPARDGWQCANDGAVRMLILQAGCCRWRCLVGEIVPARALKARSTVEQRLCRLSKAWSLVVLPLSRLLYLQDYAAATQDYAVVEQLSAVGRYRVSSTVTFAS